MVGKEKRSFGFFIRANLEFWDFRKENFGKFWLDF
jgi:hypothetical protein